MAELPAARRRTALSKGEKFMFCPRCGLQASSDTKFCKQCGADLRGVQETLTRRGTKDFDWSKTWVAEMFMSQEEQDRRKGITPEIKRLNEIKGGIITTLSGLGAMAFLYFFMGAVAAKNPDDAEIVSRIWLCGLVPFVIGLGILFNGLVVSRRIVELQRRPQDSLPPLAAPTTSQLGDAPPQAMPPYSVADPTTALLQTPPPSNISASRENA
jgi:hypothetical protein